jgi:hypothetical protein
MMSGWTPFWTGYVRWDANLQPSLEGIRCFFDPWIRIQDQGWKKIQI